MRSDERQRRRDAKKEREGRERGDKVFEHSTRTQLDGRSTTSSTPVTLHGTILFCANHTKNIMKRTTEFR
jgi:hypothetical protein